MKVFRFMGKKEFELLMEGVILYNDTKHVGGTSSVGFCFMDSDEYKPMDAIRFLSGIVSMGYCVEFEVNMQLNESYGIYATPIEETGNYLIDFFNLYQRFNNKFKAKEYCTTYYNKELLKPIRYAQNITEIWLKDVASKKNIDFNWKNIKRENYANGRNNEIL